MEPFTIALLAGTALSAAGAAAGAMGGSNSAAAKAQNELNWANYYLQQREMRDKKEMAQAASTDPLGNRTYYTPGVGWRTDATPQTEQLLRSIQSEQQQQYGADAQRNRIIAQQAFRRAQAAGSEADIALGQVRNPSQTREGFLGRAMESNVADAVTPTDNARRAIAMRAARGGGGANMLDMLSSYSQPSTRSAIARARLEAPTAFDTAEQNRQGGAVQRYAALNQSASGTPTAITPVDTGIPSTMQNARTSGNQLESYNRAPQPFQITPVPNQVAQGLGSLGATVGGLADTWQAHLQSQTNNNILMELLKSRAAGGSMSSLPAQGFLGRQY